VFHACVLLAGGCAWLTGSLSFSSNQDGPRNAEGLEFFPDASRGG
jgi:hypothetical protein